MRDSRVQWDAARRRRWSLALAALVTAVLASDDARAQTTVSEGRICLALRDRFSADDALEEILRVELAGLGASFAGQNCLPVSVEAVSSEVALVRLEGRAPRIVDLEAVRPPLRPRSLALTIAEEINSLRVDRPPLRAAPDPTGVEGPNHLSIPQGSGEGSDAFETGGTSLLIAGWVGHAFGSDHTVGGMELGAEVHVGNSLAGSFRWGIEGAYGKSAVQPFGDLGVAALGGTLAWAWRLLQNKELTIIASPGLAAGVTWLSADVEDGAVASEQHTTTPYLRLHATLLLSWQLAPSIALEFGPSVGALLVAPEIFGEGELIGGWSGFWLAGRAGVRIGL